MCVYPNLPKHDEFTQVLPYGAKDTWFDNDNGDWLAIDPKTSLKVVNQIFKCFWLPGFYGN